MILPKAMLTYASAWRKLKRGNVHLIVCWQHCTIWWSRGNIRDCWITSKNGWVVKAENNQHDCLSHIKFSDDKRKAWPGQTYLIESLKNQRTSNGYAKQQNSKHAKYFDSETFKQYREKYLQKTMNYFDLEWDVVISCETFKARYCKIS